MSSEIQYYARRLGQLRQVFEKKKKTFKELRRYLAPNTGMFEDDDYLKMKDQFLQDNINTMPYKYNITLATMLGSNFTSPSVRWFKMNQRNTKPTREERRYFQETENLMYDVFEDSNLHPTLYNVYLEAQTYGTGAGYKVKSNKDNVMRFRPLTIGEYYIEENSDGEVDVLYRYINLDLRQLEQMFGYDNIPDKYKMLYKQGKFDTYVKLWHSIEPNMKYLDAYESVSNKKFISCYFIENERDGVIEKKGQSYFPYFVARWDKFGIDPYGVGIGVTAIGDIRMLQKYERDLAKASSKKILPTMRIDPSLKKQKVDMGAGKPVYTSMKDGVSELYKVQYDTREARENISEVQERIYKYFYNDVFFAMLNADKTMSATEAAARNTEKLQMLGGIVTRWQKDFLEPIISTTYIALGEAGQLPEAPDSLAGQKVDIDYHGLTFQSIELADLANVERYMSYGANVEALAPGSLDNLDGDFLMKFGASKFDTPVEITRSDDEVGAIRAKRAEAEQAAQRTEQADAFAKTAAGTKDLSEAGTTGDNALAQMLGAA